MDNIKLVNIIFQNGESLMIKNDSIEEIYIANIDENGKEREYELSPLNGILYANFALIKIKDKLDEEAINSTKQNIVQLMIVFNNGKFIKFEMTTMLEPFNICNSNKYQTLLKNNKIIGWLVSEYSLKYQTNIFS